MSCISSKDNNQSVSACDLSLDAVYETKEGKKKKLFARCLRTVFPRERLEILARFYKPSRNDLGGIAPLEIRARKL